MSFLSKPSIGILNLTRVRQKFFHLTKTEADPMVEPHGVAGDFRGKPVTLVAVSLIFHAAQSARPELN
jgi:hypothetical protein